MGQKVPPIANRIPYLEQWSSRWFESKAIPDYIVKDFQIRQLIRNHYGKWGAISRVDISRVKDIVNVTIFTARPGLIIGSKGLEIENVRTKIADTTGETVNIQVLEVIEPFLNAQLVANTLAIQVERNINYRTAIRRMIDRVMSAQATVESKEPGQEKKIIKAQGIRIRISGRLGGAEIARSEWYGTGRMPLGTFRGDIDFGFAEALIKKGKIGIRVWIFKGERFTKTAKDLLEEARAVEKEKIERMEKIEEKALLEEMTLKETEDVDAQESKI